MSFGFGIGDFLAVIELVTRLRKDFADAPSQIRDLSTELKTFSFVLLDAEVNIAAVELDTTRREALDLTLISAREILNDLQGFIVSNKPIFTVTGSKARVKRAWKRFQFDRQEVSELRLRINTIILELQAFTSNELKHNVRKIARYINNQGQREVLEWLSDDDFHYHKNTQSHLVRNRQVGTRKWLLESDEWNSWLSSHGQTIFCPGIPGSGKTFTTAMALETLDSAAEEQGWIYAYIFCSYQQRGANQSEMLLRSLLRMVLEQTAEVPREIHHWCVKKKDPTIDEITNQLRVALEGHDHAFLLIDALDELETTHWNDLISCLFKVQAAVGVNLYFTSRDSFSDIRAQFNKAIIIPIKATKHDVGIYLTSQMEKLHVPNYIRRDHALQNEICDIIISSVGDMFLLAELHITQLLQNISKRRLQNSLKAIFSGKSDYQKAYENVMERVHSQDNRTCELATNAISLLAYAERPLLSAEFLHALSVDLDITEMTGAELAQMGDLQLMSDSLGVYDPDLAPTVEEVLAACAGLIMHQPESDIVLLVHQTAKEYLTSDTGRRRWFPKAQLKIGAICMVYLQAAKDNKESTYWPFFDYAQKHYGHHILAQSNLDGCDGRAVNATPSKDATMESNLLLSKAQPIIDQIGLARLAQELGGMEDVLLAACKINQLNFARVLLSTQKYRRPAAHPSMARQSSPFSNAECAIDRALIFAVENGLTELVDLLLKFGASPMTLAHGRLDLVRAALKEDFNEIVVLLLEAVNSPGARVFFLSVASDFGDQKTVAQILEHGSLTMSMMQHEEDGFHDSWKAEEAFVDRSKWKDRLTLGQGTYVTPRQFFFDSKFFIVQSPICRAAYAGYPQCVKILWEWIDNETKKVHDNVARNRVLGNAAVCAIAGGHVNVLKLLPPLANAQLPPIADGLALWHMPRIPNILSIAVSWTKLGGPGRIDAVEYLLRDENFELSIRDGCYRNPLTEAIKTASDSFDVIRLILEEKGDQLINLLDENGDTPLLCAVRENNTDAMNMLLCYPGIQPDLKNMYSSGPIDAALDYGYVEAVVLLTSVMEHGVNRLDSNGSTLLHHLIDNNLSRRSREVLPLQGLPTHVERLKRFEGCKIFTCRQMPPNCHGQQIHPYLSRCNVSMLRRVLEAASVTVAQVRSSPCKCGIGTIFLAISTENVEAVEALLDFDPDLVNDRFYDGSSPLDLAACIHNARTRQSMIDLILSKKPIVRTFTKPLPRSPREEDYDSEDHDCDNLCRLFADCSKRRLEPWPRRRLSRRPFSLGTEQTRVINGERCAPGRYVHLRKGIKSCKMMSRRKGKLRLGTKLRLKHNVHS
ncbi:hypothetical protein N0V93_009709 [Gnomoniopsis smithogilvyi]|uniref:Nephrocystin 3-like N-terminal domain-containing protein n=1 Tax=Gnomoniopsis smithogilvyi TaxID=1191159 RepID=A0A9W8YL16_9PEZI|nr:hypothetical protein N0V93_009709 [Gnomoniopsis smithogilvyi]